MNDKPPFESVTQALSYWRRWQEAMRSGMAIPIKPRESSGGMPLRGDILATYMSVDVIVNRTLSEREKEALDRVFNSPGRRWSVDVQSAYRGALTKLGRVMRAENLVG